MTEQCYIYHICRESDKWNFTKGYIGISRKPSKRWRSGYGRTQSHIRNALKKYPDIIRYVFGYGRESRIKELENELRPIENMGWNIARGGGFTPSPKDKPHCVGKIPLEKKTRKGSKHSTESRLKMSMSHKKIAHLNSRRMTDNNPMHGVTGEKHPSFKGWFVTPGGRFGSASAAAKANGLASGDTVSKRCKDGSVILRTRGIPREWLGKTWKELGWYFEEK